MGASHHRSPARSLAMGALALGCVALTGCGTTGPGAPFSIELANNARLWAGQAPDAYRYAVRRLCFCGPEAIGPVRMDVVDGQVVSMVYVEGGGPVDSDYESLFPTVEGLFAVLADALERDAVQIDVTWDPETGIPVDFFIDYDEGIADEELGFTVTEMPEAIDPE